MRWVDVGCDSMVRVAVEVEIGVELVDGRNVDLNKVRVPVQS